MICILPLADLKKTTVPLQSLISPYLTMNGGKFRKVFLFNFTQLLIFFPLYFLAAGRQSIDVYWTYICQ